MLEFVKQLKKSLICAEEYNKSHVFSDWDEMVTIINKTVFEEYWTCIQNNGNIYFFHFEMMHSPEIKKSVCIDRNCVVTAYDKKVDIKKLGKFSLPLKVTNINEICDILCLLKKSTFSINDALESINDLLFSVLDKIDENKKNVVLCILEQISLLKHKKNSHNYSCNYLILTSLLYSISPHSYRFLRNSNYLILPHPNTLRMLCSKHNVDPKKDENFDYIRNKFTHLNDNDKTVILMMDEIYLKPYLDYKGGDIMGMSINTTNAAVTAFVFMIQSLTSSYKDVVKILPTQTIDAKFLHSVLLFLIKDLESVGFSVLCISSDNNSVNRRAVSLFSDPPKQTFLYKHPLSSTRPLFYVRDPVHLFKCIRNNWLNQKNTDKSFYFPAFKLIDEDELENEQLTIPHTSINKTASFNTLKTIFELESNELVKECHTLTYKSIFPSNLDRQNVKLVVQIFNSHVIEGLLKAGPKHNLIHYEDTADFLKIILNWWEIMNVKSVFKGFHKRNELQEPLVFSKLDIKCRFLYSFLDWLQMWKKSNVNSGHLSNETHEALFQTTYAILEIARYCKNELGLNFILTGKFQTDSLENRFGQYRQLAGGQYNISLTQLLEVEKKLRIQSILPFKLNSNTFGSYNVNASNLENTHKNIPNDLNLSKHHIETQLSLLKKFNFCLNEEDILEVVQVEEILCYISGYCVNACLNRVKCNFCKEKLTITKEASSSNSVQIKDLDRGGLKYPSDAVVEIVSISYLIIKKLISKEFEEDFLRNGNHRTTAYLVINYFLSVEEKDLDFESCENNHSCSLLQNYIIHSCINILLKNYCKNFNNNVKKSFVKKRKLKTVVDSNSAKKKTKMKFEKETP